GLLRVRPGRNSWSIPSDESIRLQSWSRPTLQPAHAQGFSPCSREFDSRRPVKTAFQPASFCGCRWTSKRDNEQEAKGDGLLALRPSLLRLRVLLVLLALTHPAREAAQTAELLR